MGKQAGLPDRPPGTEAGRSPTVFGPFDPRRHLAFLAAGFAATAAQVLLLRELIVDVAGDEAAIGVGLAAWLVGIGTGASVARRRRADGVGRGADRPSTHLRGVALLALLPPLAILAGRLLRRMLAPAAGELPGLGVTLLLVSATLLPCGLVVGWLFTRLAAAASRSWRDGEAVARLYVVESLGSLAGGVAVTLLAGRLPPLRASALFGLVATLLALADGLGHLGSRPEPRLRALAGRWPLLVGACLCAGIAIASRPLGGWSERLRFAGTAPGVPLLASADTPYQHLALAGGEVRYLYTSGQYAASFPDPYSAESLGHLLALFAPHPRRVLLLGGMERGLVPVLLRHPVTRLTLVEPDRRKVAFLMPWLSADERAALADPRVRVVVDDPRRFLAGARAGSFDLVLLLGPDPATLLRARLATTEFFRLVAEHLSPEGALVVSLPAAPTVLVGETAALAAAVVRSLCEALPVVHVTPPDQALAVAGLSPSAITLDPAVLAARWRERAIASPSFDAALLPALLPKERTAAHEAALLAAAGQVRASRDDRPVSFLHALARRQQMVSGSVGRLVRLVPALPPWLLIALAFTPSLLVAGRVVGKARSGTARERDAAVTSHAVAVAGAAGLGWSLLLLFSFQTHAGALYGQLGALVAFFMLGLALGAAVVGADAARSQAEARVAGPSRVSVAGAGNAFDTDRPARVLRLCLLLSAAFGLALPAALAGAARLSSAGALWALLWHGVLLLAAGAATGAVFPAAAEVRLAGGEGRVETAARLETADHAGASLAALTGAVVFVPLLGLDRAALLLAGLLVVAVAIVHLAARSRSD